VRVLVCIRVCTRVCICVCLGIFTLPACGGAAPRSQPTLHDPEPVTQPGPPARGQPVAGARAEPGRAPAAPAPAAPEPAAISGSKLDAELAFCVSETNRYRASAGKKPLRRSSEMEAFAAEGARLDGNAHRAHHHFATGSFRGSYSGLAENELPWWPLSRYGSLREIMRQGIASMWGEGPGGGHHDNMLGDYAEMGCGIYIRGDEVTVVQDYREP
jgi:uncharacterized protein YkwD